MPVDLGGMPSRHAETVAYMLRNPRPLDNELLAGGRVITDAINPAADDLASAQMANRKYSIEALPAAFFVN